MGNLVHSDYQIEILRNAEQESERASAMRRAQLAPSDLGSLDRGDQLRALRQGLRVLGQQSDALGMCVIVHGQEGYGQPEFLQFLKSWPEWESSAGARVIAPPFDMIEADELIRSALTTFRRTKSSRSRENGVRQLAQVLLEASGQEPQVLLIGGLDRMKDGLTGFQRNFWLPLHRALLTARPRGSQWRANFITVVVAWGERLSNPRPAGSPPARQKLVTLRQTSVCCCPCRNSASSRRTTSKFGCAIGEYGSGSKQWSAGASSGRQSGQVYERLREGSFFGQIASESRRMTYPKYTGKNSPFYLASDEVVRPLSWQLS